MALESWLTKAKVAIRSTMNTPNDPVYKKSNVGILSFEIASIMSKLVHLWRSLADVNVARLCRETITSEGIRKVISDDDTFLLGLACAELTETLRVVAESTSNLSKRCVDEQLRQFGQIFKNFADSGHDPNGWVMSMKDMDSKLKKMDRYVASTAALCKEMDELSEAEHGLRKLVHSRNNLKSSKITSVAEIQQKVFWKRQEVKYMKQASLWSCTFDAVISLLAKSSFTVLSRIKQVFSIGHETQDMAPQLSLPRSLSASSVVYPSSVTPPVHWSTSPKLQQGGFFETSTSMIIPPPTTLGASALAMHYASVILVIEKMIRSPRCIGPDVRDDLYGMLPASVRCLLRNRLRGVGWGGARDVGLAADWKAALKRIMEWLGPVAQNTIRWQGERSFERRNMAAPRANVLLLQTLYFANREKVEAAIAELLVGLNYVWRYEMEMASCKFS